ncbi:hypothetical protein F511_14140 [Dorcoceras hygrometricum]|uniref:Uncharacterized protein n=1 Tax=Dorcoceras hygrometricum TaxID=472368 RepID=A0A2Z7D2H6_9LAMI|nr:hypothetical protein F511_14140 [Dorcoceras hygrometricum]
MFSKIKTCATAKDIWEKLTQICEGNDETKENKLTVAQQKYESMKMKDGETMTEFDERFSAVVIELTSFGKEYSNRELALKVMRALPREWDVKTMAMRESKDLNKLELHDLFANLKAYEFELETRSEAGPSTSQPTKALAATTSEQCSPSTRKTADQLSNDVMSLFVKKFGKLSGNHGGSGSLLPERQRKNKNWAGRRSIRFNNQQAMTFIGCLDDYLAGNSCLAPTSFTRKPALHGRWR